MAEKEEVFARKIDHVKKEREKVSKAAVELHQETQSSEPNKNGEDKREWKTEK